MEYPGGDEHKLLMGVPYERRSSRRSLRHRGEECRAHRGGCGYLHAVIQIKKTTEGDARTQ